MRSWPSASSQSLVVHCSLATGVCGGVFRSLPCWAATCCDLWFGTLTDWYPHIFCHFESISSSLLQDSPRNFSRGCFDIKMHWVRRCDFSKQNQTKTIWLNLGYTRASRTWRRWYRYQIENRSDLHHRQSACRGPSRSCWDITAQRDDVDRSLRNSSPTTAACGISSMMRHFLGSYVSFVCRASVNKEWRARSNQVSPVSVLPFDGILRRPDSWSTSMDILVRTYSWKPFRNPSDEVINA